jgi:ADP-ribose pyrophosphatase
MKQHGPWQIVHEELVYADPWIRVRKDDVIRPDGRPGIHTVINLKPGVSVLALDEERNAYLTEEFHYGVGRVTLEVVSGGCEATEDPLCSAQRELQEELGIIADQWDDLGICDPFTANVVSPTRLYLARRLQFGSTAPEGTEQIRCVKMPFDEVVAWVMESRITHAPSCLAILKAARVLKNQA